MKVGIIGLGRMGTAISLRLHEQGFSVIGWDHSAAANRAAAGTGLAIADHPRDAAAQSDFIISSITEDNGARQIFAGPDGFLRGDITGKLFIEMSTLQPMTGRELAQQVETRGGHLIDAPVLGTIPQARAGTLFAMVGGRSEEVELARPVLGKLARRIVHLGPHGSGHAMKLAANVGLGTYIAALSESLALGARYGLTVEQMLEVLQESATACSWLKNKAEVLKGATADMTLDIATLRKDIMSAVATGALAGVPMPVASGTLAALSAAVKGEYGNSDIAELPRFFREAMLQSFGR